MTLVVVTYGRTSTRPEGKGERLALVIRDNGATVTVHEWIASKRRWRASCSTIARQWVLRSAKDADLERFNWPLPSAYLVPRPDDEHPELWRLWMSRTLLPGDSSERIWPVGRHHPVTFRSRQEAETYAERIVSKFMYQTRYIVVR